MWKCPICFQEYSGAECPQAGEPWHSNMVRQHEEIDRAKMNLPVQDRMLNAVIRKEIWEDIDEVNPYAIENGRGNHIGRIRVMTRKLEMYEGDEVSAEGEHFTIWWVDRETGKIDNFAVLKYEDILSFDAEGFHAEGEY